MDILLGIYAFILGAIFGSFALVVTSRMHSSTSWLRGRSQCDHCGHVLGPLDLIPIISWVAQRGRCRYCRKKLSAYYPLVELGLSAAFAASYVFAPYDIVGSNALLFVLWLCGLVIMTSLVVADFKWFLLPSKLVYPLVGIAGVHWLVATFANNDQAVINAVVALTAALLASSGLFWLLHRLSDGRWIGDGDYRLGAAIALYLGTLPLTWFALFSASVLGLFMALPVALRSKKKTKVKIPFGPFLILGLIVAYLFGSSVVDWYTDTFLSL